MLKELKRNFVFSKDQGGVSGDMNKHDSPVRNNTLEEDRAMIESRLDSEELAIRNVLGVFIHEITDLSGKPTLNRNGMRELISDPDKFAELLLMASSAARGKDYAAEVDLIQIARKLQRKDIWRND